MNVLITGASGFLGKNLIKALDRKKVNLFSLDSKICNLFYIENLNQYNNIKFDYIFHLAAWIQGGEFSKNNKGKILENNNKINNNILDWIIREQQNTKLIVIGSSGAYDVNLELKEENYLNGSPHKSLYEYGMSKRNMYSRLINLNKKYNIKYLHLIPTTIYGPNYHTNRRNMQFIYDLIKKIYLGKFKNCEVTLWGNGLQQRQLLYIKDFIDIILDIFEFRENTSYNICPKKFYSIKKYADLICQEIGFDQKKIFYDINRFVGAQERILSNKKFILDYPKYNFTNIKNGLKHTIEWSKENLIKVYDQNIN